MDSPGALEQQRAQCGPRGLTTPEQVVEAFRLELISKHEARSLLGLPEEPPAPASAAGDAKTHSARTHAIEGIQAAVKPRASDGEADPGLDFAYLPKFAGQLLAEFLRDASPPGPRRSLRRDGWVRAIEMAASWLHGKSWGTPRTVADLELELNTVLGKWDRQLIAAGAQAQLDHGVFKEVFEATSAFAGWAVTGAPDGRGTRWEYHAEHWLRHAYPDATDEQLGLASAQSASTPATPHWFAVWIEIFMRSDASVGQEGCKEVLERLGQHLADLYSPQQWPDGPPSWESVAEDDRQRLGQEAFERQVEIADAFIGWLNADARPGSDSPRWEQLASDWEMAAGPSPLIPASLPNPEAERASRGNRYAPLWFNHVIELWARGSVRRPSARALRWLGYAVGEHGWSEPCALERVLVVWDQRFEKYRARQGSKTLDALLWMVPAISEWGVSMLPDDSGMSRWEWAIADWNATQEEVDRA